MRRTFVFTVILGVLVSGAVFAQEDIRSVIPQKALVAFVSKNPQTFEDHVGQMVTKLSGEAMPKGFLLDELLREAKLHSRQTVEGTPVAKVLPTVMDRTQPMAVVVMAPDVEESREPVAYVVNVSDYRKFLAEVCEIAGAPGPEVTPDGTDVIKGRGRPIYLLQMGKFAVVTPAEFVIRGFKEGAEKNLGGNDVPSFKDAFEKGDVAVYVNIDEVFKAFAFQINSIKMMFGQMMLQNPPQDLPFPPEKMVKMVNATVDTANKLGREVDAITAAVNLGEEGVQGILTFQAMPDSSVAKIAAGFKPAPLDLLTLGDGPVLAAAGMNMQQGAVDEMVKVLTDFLKQIEIFGDAAENEKALAMIKKMTDAATGRGAMFLMAPKEGKPVLWGASVSDIKPGSDIRGVLREYAEFQPGILKEFNKSGLKVDTKMDTDVETHRGVSIDRLTVTFAVGDEVPAEQADMMRRMFNTMYGNPMVEYYAVAKDKVIQTMGDSTTTTVKEWIDRVLDGKKGNVMQDPMFMQAMKGLPEQRAGVVVFGLAEAMKGFIGADIMNDQQVAEAVQGVRFEKPSGIGLTFGSVQKGCAVNFSVPMQEMLNVKKIGETMMQVVMQRMFQQQ